MPPEPGAELVGFATRAVLRIDGGQASAVDDALAEELPLELRYDGVSFAVMMVSPGALEDFALGFSLSEGLLDAPAQLLETRLSVELEGMVLDLRTDGAARMEPIDQGRLLPGRSGCGLCGSRTLERAVRHPAKVGDGPRIDAAVLECALAELRERQPLNARTGSVHAAAWADQQGAIRLVREDVGRHNALDKLIGALHREGVAIDSGFAVITSRASYEMVTKAAVSGISLLAAISAPTALAVHLARDCGLTLVGFARPGRHVIYSHPHRLRGSS